MTATILTFAVVCVVVAGLIVCLSTKGLKDSTRDGWTSSVLDSLPTSVGEGEALPGREAAGASPCAAVPAREGAENQDPSSPASAPGDEVHPRRHVTNPPSPGVLPKT